VAAYNDSAGTERQESVRPILKAGVLYFALVFGAVIDASRLTVAVLMLDIALASVWGLLPPVTALLHTPF
jgi:hypothetical protein